MSLSLRICTGVLLALAASAGCSERAELVTPLPDAAAPDAAEPDAAPDAAPDANLPPIVLDPIGPYDPDQLARMAVFIGSCFTSNVGFYGVGAMLFGYDTVFGDNPFYLALLRTAGCFANKANGCKALEECTGIITTVPVDPCQGGCAGTTKVLCDVNAAYRIPCDRLGLICSINNNILCRRAPLEPCVPGAVDPCKDGAPHWCEPGLSHIIEGPLCSDYGLLCGIEPDYGRPICQGTGAACSFYSNTVDRIRRMPLSACDGATATRCYGGYEQTFDCGAIAKGFSCQSWMGSSFCGLGSACDTDNPTAVCEGDSIVLCNAGRIDKIDCKSLGFTGCDPTLNICF